MVQYNVQWWIIVYCVCVSVLLDDDDDSSVSQANTVEMVNTPPGGGGGGGGGGVDDLKSYTTYDQHSVDDLDEEKEPLDVRTITVNKWMNEIMSEWINE